MILLEQQNQEIKNESVVLGIEEHYEMGSWGSGIYDGRFFTRRKIYREDGTVLEWSGNYLMTLEGALKDLKRRAELAPKHIAF